MLRTEQIGEETRYDPETLKKVIALASRLQDRHQGTLTAAQIEDVGADVGLDSAFVRQALAQVTRSQPQPKAATSAELNSILFALAFPLIWGPLAYILRHAPDLMTIFSQVTPAPLAGLLGFIAGKRKVGMLAGLALAASLFPVWGDAIPGFWRDGPYFLVFALAGAFLGSLGASVRETYFPFPSNQRADSLPQSEVLRALSSLQVELQKDRSGGGDTV